MTSSAWNYVDRIEKQIKETGAKTAAELLGLAGFGCNLQGFLGDPEFNSVTAVDFGTYAVIRPMVADLCPYFDHLPHGKRGYYNFPYAADPKRAVSIANWGIEPRDPQDLSKGFVDHFTDWAQYWSSRLSGPKASKSEAAFKKARLKFADALQKRLAAEQSHWDKSDPAQSIGEQEPKTKRAKAAPDGES